MKKIARSLQLLFTFCIEFFYANLSVAAIVLFRKSSSIQPHLVDYPTPELSRAERILLAQMITLTPGTISCEVNHASKKLRIHILDAADPNEVLDRITRRFKDPLRKVNR